MREHEVPTHVQTEDKVLLWFTFPQIAAMLAAGGLAYGLWRFLPIGSDEVRLGLAAAVALIGVTAAMGKIGGRRLPMVAADLLRFQLTPRRYEGPPSELARTQSPAPVEKRPSQLTAFARRMKASAAAVRRRRPLRGDRKRKTKGQRRPFRPHARFGKGRGTHAAVLAAAALAAIAVMAAHPQRSAADGPPTDEDLDWLDGVEFRPPEPIPGRRVFVEELKVANGRATVGLRAATDLDLHVRAFGGPQGNRILFSDSADLQQAERVQYVMRSTDPVPP